VTTRRTPLPSAFVVAAALLFAGCNGSNPSPADHGVHGMEYGEFTWAGGEPTVAIGPMEAGAVREDVARAGAVIDDDRDADFPIEIVAPFPSANEAEQHAAVVRTILHDAAAWYADPAHATDRAALDDPNLPPPMIPPEADAMKANLLAAGTRGIGWGGAPDDAAASVRTLGPLLFVTGLKSDHWATDLPPVHPLSHLLAAQGADVREAGGELTEGIAVDISCHVTDPATGPRLRDDIGDGLIGAAAYDARAPWIDPPITDKQRLARATLARFTAGFAAALSNADTQAMAERLLAATTPEERAAAMKDFEAKIESEGVRRVEGQLDPEVLALLLGRPESNDPKADAAWRAQLGDALGALAVRDVNGTKVPAQDDTDRQAVFGADRLHGDRLEISSLSFMQFSAGFSSLAAYLTDNGCDDIKIGLVKSAP
jgi:hypothetical protein